MASSVLLGLLLSAQLPLTLGSGGVNSSAAHPSYETLDSSFIEEYGIWATRYRHTKSGAQVVSVVAPEDSNKVFGAVFRTPSDDSRGLPHVLEHSVLCGSRRFPVKEPFVDLIKGSLNTFLNAFTYPDRTCYPVASMNTKDFYNLAEVYLDAVLHPRAVSDPQVLQQEGWHYELRNRSEALEYKGVVYNEMKGVYSSPDAILGRATRRALFPDNAYSQDAGGDPREIPGLGFAQLRDYHAKYYHPSNARFYFYGDDDPLVRLQLLDGFLAEFDAIDVRSSVAVQKRRPGAEARLELSFPVQAGAEPKHMLTVNWLLHDEALSAREKLELRLLDSLLLGRSSSPLRKALTESQLGESVNGGGLSDELLQATFSVGLKGVRPGDAPRVEALVLAQLTRLSAEGFDEADVRAALNTHEFSLREFNTGGFPRGLSLMLDMHKEWNYDRDPFEAVRFERPLASLKRDLAAGEPVFRDLLRRCFVDNGHRVTVEMVPDAGLEQKNAEWETRKLAAIKDGMSSEELEAVVEGTRLLQEAQAREDSPEAKATLPRLALADIEKEVQAVPIAVEQRPDGSRILSHELQTNGILYVDVGFDYSSVRASELPLLPLLTRMLTEAGTETLSEVELQRRIGAETGGLSASRFECARYKHVAEARRLADSDDPVMYVTLRGKATRDKAGSLFELLQEVLLRANLGNERRAIEMLKEARARLRAAVVTSGHSFGAKRLAARHSLLGYVSEVTGGLTYARGVAALLEQAQADWPSLQARLEALRRAIVRKASTVLNLSGSRDVLQAAAPLAQRLLRAVPEGAAECGPKLAATFRASELLPIRDEGFSVPSQVNYVVKGARALREGDGVNGAYSVASRHLSLSYLWDTVRVMGGAYGGFSQFGRADGRATFLSYRDPNLASTLSTFDAAASVLSEDARVLSAADVQRAVIGTVGSLDAPAMPDEQGLRSMQRHLSGESTAHRQAWRDEVLGASATDFGAFARKLEAVRKEGSVVVFGSEAALRRANEQLPAGRKLALSQAVEG